MNTIVDIVISNFQMIIASTYYIIAMAYLIKDHRERL